MDEKSIAFSGALVALFRGFISREVNAKHWNTVCKQQTQIDDYVSKIGLALVVDDADGYAYLKQQTQVEDHLEIPRLIPRYQLSYPVSVMLVLLRKLLLERDSVDNAARLILTKQELSELMRPYLKDTSNEVKQRKDMDINLNKIREMGFIRMLNGTDDRFEVLRILRSFVDAQWLGEMDQRLQEYQALAQGGAMQKEGEHDEQ